MSYIYISIGSNINQVHYINAALKALEQSFNQLLISSVYESEAVGFSGDNFYNLVVGAHTQLSLEQVINKLKLIEAQNGRTRNKEKFSARTLDLDLLTYDDMITEQPTQIPRSEITENAFVLCPLAEIAPDTLLPGTNTSYQQLWQNYNASSQKLWPIKFDRG